MNTERLDPHAVMANLSPHDFRQMGLNEMAYIRTVEVDGATAYAIHAADGTPLMINETFETACGVILENQMFPVVTH